MRPGAKVMFTIAAFLGIMTIIYILATIWVQDDGYLFGLEWVGAVALTLSFVLAMMLGGYIQFVANRIDLLPEDFEEAEIEDATGTLGFFSPNSIWPFAMSLSIAVLGFGVIYLYFWMIALGAVLLVWSTSMMSLQYGIPKQKH